MNLKKSKKILKNTPKILALDISTRTIGSALFDIQQKNRLEQNGLLKRFSIICYGHQESVEEMRAEKAKKFKELKDKRGTREFEEWFLSYRPSGKRKGEKDKGEKDKGEKDKGEKKKNNKSFKKTFKFRTWKNKNKTSKNKNELY